MSNVLQTSDAPTSFIHDKLVFIAESEVSQVSWTEPELHQESY